MDGKDKGLVLLAGRPLIEFVVDAIRPQVDTIIVNANRNVEQYSLYGYPVVSDALGGFQGPLAGYLASLSHVSSPYIVTLPCDGPFVPGDLVKRLIQALTPTNAEIAVAHDGERLQPVYALIPSSLESDLNAFLETGERKIDRWYRQHRIALADFSDCPGAFRNINTAEQCDNLQREGLLR